MCAARIGGNRPGPLATTHREGRVMTEYKIPKNTERRDSMSGAPHRT
jgi:hypothetical protein